MFNNCPFGGRQVREAGRANSRKYVERERLRQVKSGEASGLVHIVVATAGRRMCWLVTMATERTPLLALCATFCYIAMEQQRQPRHSNQPGMMNGRS